jgi:hypothetical protein
VREAGILKVIHAVSELLNDPGPEESRFGAGAPDSLPLPDRVTERFGVALRIAAYLNRRES